MNPNTHYFTLDLDRQDSQVFVNVRKGDTAVRLSCLLRAGGSPYEITDGTTAVLAASLPSGTYTEAACTIAENRMEITLRAEHTANAGHIAAHFKLKERTSLLSSPQFTIVVDDPDDGYDVPSGGGGTSDYSELSNKPQINGHTINAGDQTGNDLGLVNAIDLEFLNGDDVDALWAAGEESSLEDLSEVDF